MKPPDVAQAGGFGEPEAGDRLHQRHGPAQRQHVGARQVDDEGLEAGAVLQRARHVVGEPSLGAGPACGAFLDLGVDATLDDLEHDVVENAAFPVDRIDVCEVGAACVAGLDGDRLLDGGLPEVVARLRVRLRALAAAAGTPCGLVPVRLRRREAGVPRSLAGRPFQQNGDQDARQGEQDADHGIDLFGHLAVLSQRGDAGLRALELLAQRRRVHRRHHPASTAITAASTASRSPGGVARQTGSRPWKSKPDRKRWAQPWRSSTGQSRPKPSIARRSRPMPRCAGGLRFMIAPPPKRVSRHAERGGMRLTMAWKSPVVAFDPYHAPIETAPPRNDRSATGNGMSAL